MIGETYQNVKAALQQWSERRAMRKWDNLPDETRPAPKPMLPRRRQWQAFGFAGGVFLAALAAPGISRVTRQQVGLSLRLGGVQSVTSLWKGMPSSAWAYQQTHGRPLVPALATDVEVQAAKGLFSPEGDIAQNDAAGVERAFHDSAPQTALQKQRLLQSLPALRAVMARFPNNPLPRAAFLTRVCNFGSLNIITDPWRGDTQVTPTIPLLQVRPAATAQNASARENDRCLLKQCEQAAAEGERLEPDNAYFPVMLAHLHFAAHDDQAALADIDRASRQPRWEDYNNALIRGACRLHDAQLGVSNSLLHQSAFDSVFILSGSLYDTARHLQLLAWKQEHAGNSEAEIALRGRMMRIGTTIRDQARGRFVSGSGEALFLFACNRLHIEKGKYAPTPESPQEVANYVPYLRRHGHAAEADWVQRQLKYFAPSDVIPLYQSDSSVYDSRNWPGYDPSYDPGIMARCVRWFWDAGLLTLAEIAMLLLLGGLAAWQNYRHRFSLNRPRPFARPIVWGIGLALLLITCVLIVTTLGLTQGLAVAMDTLPILGLLCLTLLVAGLMRGARDTALSALLTFVIGCALMGTAFVQISGALLRAEEWQVASNLYETINGGKPLELTGKFFNMTLLTLAPLLLCVLWMALRSRIRRVPVGWGVWRGLSTTLLPLLSMALLGYALVGLATTRAEAQADNAFVQLLDNENQYTRDMYREVRRNAQQWPSLRTLRFLTGDIHAFNLPPFWFYSPDSASAR